MATLATIAIELTANSAKMVSELQKTNRRMDTFASKAKKSIGIVKAAFLAAGTVAGVNFVRDALKAGDQIQKLSIRLGATTEALSQFQHVAELSGISFRTFSLGLQRSTRRISEAAAGTGEAKKALEELGLSAKALNQLRPEQQFEVLAEALSRVENEADRVRLAMKFFDSEGVALLQTMQKGAAGIREMREEAHKLGLTLTKEQADSMAKANDAITRLSAAGVRLRNVLATALGPAIADIANWLSDHLPAAINVAKKGIIVWLEAISRATNVIFKLQSTVTGVFGHLPGFVGDKFQQASEAIDNFNQKIQDTIDSMQEGLKPTAVKEFKSEVQDGALSLENFSNTYEVYSNSMDELFDGYSKTMEKAKSKTKESNEELNKMTIFADQAARNMQSAFADFLFDPFEDGLDGMLKSFSNTLRRMAAEMVASQVFSAIGSSLSGSANPILQSAGNFFSQNFGGARADGGAVSAGKAFLVGEHGPELFTPHVSGHITANERLSGNNIVVHQNFDFRNAGKGAASELRKESKRIQDSTLAAVRAEIIKGGPMARSVGVKR